MLQLKEVLETLPSCSPCNLYTCPECGKDFRAIVSQVEAEIVVRCPECQKKADAIEEKERNRIALEEKGEGHRRRH